METARVITLFVSTVTTGLIAGLFYAYSCSVMIALRRVEDRVFVEVMNRINVAILNVWFVSCFVGGLVATAAVVALQAAGAQRPLLPVVSALVLYIAMIMITRGRNIPLNNELAATQASDPPAELARARQRFEGPWVRWNLVRTLLSIAAFCCMVGALLVA
ncbi:DUF1772 domain-containing protein [Lipingzhangella sp. LS1_29]|uniref:DUF1772 domain-containing protein n=1 Tax=Lipingzhangella rawalii TaxID=2055835 RepID=A0ABU2HAV3_9ACTN|nr:anthrone oxygenase family protein [Lipingzhangella rawalii]MDS1272459.1 DUF1772 domain-containing protein [Lipingzhangella rawalii]